MKQLVLVAMVLFLNGCAAPYRERSISTDHPASPGGEEAPLPTHWQTLDLAAADPVAPAQKGSAMEHAGHEMRDTHQGKSLGSESAAHHDAPPASAPEPAALYACPMHPEITSDKPDQRCPKCGMKLKKRDGANQP